MSDYEFGDAQILRKFLARQVTVSDGENILARSGLDPDPVDRVACRIGDASCAGAHASTLSRSARLDRSSTERSLLRLQRQYGNTYVGQVLSLAHADQGSEPLADVEQSIDRARGGGQALDREVRGQMESSFGADFGGVRVHTDAHADSLNHALSARAFTTGQDIFFRQGEYSPGTSSGRELLAHELTHVVQQNGDQIRLKMTVSQPGDPHEVEADQMARAIVQQEQHPTANAVRQASEKPEEEQPVQMQLNRSDVHRQPEAVKEEEEKKRLGMKADSSQLGRREEEKEPKSGF